MAVSNVSSTSTNSAYSNKLRFSGLASGLDTDSIISSLMKAERIPLDKIYQKKQLAEWKQDSYREMTSLLQGLKSDFLDFTKPTNNMLSGSTYMKFTGTSTNSSIVTATGGVGAIAGSHKVSVTNIATADKAVSSAGVTADLKGSAVSSYNLSGKTISVTLDGVTKEIKFDASITGDTDIEAGFQTLLDNAFGAGKIDVAFDSGSKQISLDTINGASKITVWSGSSESTDAASLLGFTPGTSNRLDVNQSLQSLSTKFSNAGGLTFDGSGKLKFSINGKSFEFDKSATLSTMMSTINNDSTANVNMSYDEVSDKFVLTSKQLGAGDNIIIGTAQSGNFFGASGASGIITGSAATEQGKDAVVEIDGQTIVRSSNTFTVNGTTYTVTGAHSSPTTQSETVSLSLDVDSVYNNIKSFVDKYNDVIAKINDKIGETYDRDYPPLTSEQKESMSEDDIKAWETKAKTGLLRNDSLLQNALYSMRSALSDTVQGVTGNLASIGITTGTYLEKGKLIIDETKLKAAISSNPENVMNMFSQKSTTVTSNYNLTASQKSTRMKEEGLAYRISDILDENIRTTGGKGVLLEKAGTAGDSTEYDNLITDEIDGYDKSITSWIDKLKDKEDAYYAKYSALETYISKMNSQSSWLSSQLGTSS